MSFSVGLLHGDMSQMERNDIISSFKKKEVPILGATDVAGQIFVRYCSKRGDLLTWQVRFFLYSTEVGRQKILNKRVLRPLATTRKGFRDEKIYRLVIEYVWS